MMYKTYQLSHFLLIENADIRVGLCNLALPPEQQLQLYTDRPISWPGNVTAYNYNYAVVQIIFGGYC